MKQGDIVPIDFPFSDLSERKVRPAVVISNTTYNKHRNIILAGIYGKETPGSLRLTNDDLCHKRLRKESHISLQNIFSAERSLFGQPIDTLTTPALTKLLKSVARCF